MHEMQRACTGNGSQWPGMGRELLRASPAFRAGVQACADALTPFGVDLMAAYEQDGAWDDPVLAGVGLASLQVGPPSCHLLMHNSLS
jgi:fatty acid synthase